MQSWKYEYNGNNIEIKNEASKCEMYINGEKVSESKGLDFYGELHGTINDNEQVLAILLGKTFTVECKVYITKNELQEIE